MTNPRLHQIWAGVSLVLFLAMAGAHFAALASVWVMPPVALVPLFLLVFAGQFIVLRGFGLGGSVHKGFSQASWWMRNQFRAMWQGIKVVPRGWVVLTAVLWFLYLPGMFFGHFLSYRQEEMPDRVGTLLGALFVAVFALLHYLLLRFVIPRRGEILARIEEEG